MKPILITSALPYANGPIHIGHLVEYIQTDIWRRFHQQRGRQVHYICADDAHGTAIMLKAKELNISPQELITKISQDHQRDFATFGVDFDYYGSTDSDKNKQFSLDIYNSLKEGGYIISKDIEQFFDQREGLFLADRLIKGTCPKCDAVEQYGDHCEKCGTTYDAKELKNPISVISNTKPTLKHSKHLFFDLPQYSDYLRQWVCSGVVEKAIARKLLEWIDAPLKPWDISRDKPYFGFPIPNEQDKYFYVWLDAPICYISAFAEYAQQSGIRWQDFWQDDQGAELYHFIGKDIINFHGLFWPAMLRGAKMRAPTNIFTHGFLTVNGQKMSKSRGTLIRAEHYAQHLPTEALRYYYASKLNASAEDIDLNMEDFIQKINSDIVGKFANLASRCIGFVHKLGNGKLHLPDNCPLWKKALDIEQQVITLYQNRKFSQAVRTIMSLTDEANSFISDKQPWQLAKLGDSEQALTVCSQALSVFYAVSVMLYPIMPDLCTKSANMLNATLDWQDGIKPLPQKHSIQEFETLISRIEQRSIDDMLATSSQT